MRNQHYWNKKRNSKISYIYWICQAFAIHMQSTISIEEQQIWFILDNSSVHWSLDVRSYLSKTRWSWIFLPQYSPELAPVELFFWQLKRLFWSRRKHTIVDLYKTSGREYLAETVSSIDKIAIMKMWKHFTFKLKESIKEIDSIFEL